MKDHCHVTGKYRGAAHNECNFKLRLNAKTVPIPIVFHNLKGYDAHFLMQAMARVQGEIKCIPTNIHFILTGEPEIYRQCEFPGFSGKGQRSPVFQNHTDTTLLFKKEIYPYEYMDSLERFSEEKLPGKRRFTQSWQGRGSRKKSTSTHKKCGKFSGAEISATTTTCT